MKIIIGSKNQTKIDAVKKEFLAHPEFAGATFEGKNVESGVSDQPKSLNETIQGAKNRAKAAFAFGDLGVGLESGLMPSDQTHTGQYNTVQCVIYDGERFFIAGGPNFEYPKEVIEKVHEGFEISDAYKEAGIIPRDAPKIGENGGAIGHMSKGRMDRVEYMQPAIKLAIIQLLYHKN